MKNIKETLLERRSIRRYERKPIDAEQLELIYEAIRNTPTSYNGQQFSVVAVSDQSLKEELYAITGQKQIKTCALFLIFCLDFYKLRLAVADKGAVSPPFEESIDGYTVGVIDASLAMMSGVAAAEAQGLATCCIGYIRTADPTAVSQLLGLPQGVAIVCGLAIGYGNEMPDLKPKLPLSLVIHQNHYTDDAAMRPLLAAYDAEVTAYNAHRAGDQTANDWALHIADYHRGSMTHPIGEYLKNQLKLKL